MHTHIYTMHKKRLRWKSHVSPLRLEPGKTRHGMSKNQGATRKHDEQYQMPAGIWMSFGLK
jgi:hypothetical protein